MHSNHFDNSNNNNYPYHGMNHHNHMDMHNNNMNHHHHHHNNINQPQPINQYQYNPPVVLVDGQQNLVNVVYPNPEIVYCTATVRSNNRRYNNGIGENGIMNALRQVQGELNLNLSSLSIIGNCNMLSIDSVEQNVIQPIIQDNQHIPSQLIRSGKVVYCCNALQKRIRKFGFILIALLFLSIAFQITGYAININDSINYNGEITPLTIPYILQIALWTFEFTMVLTSALKCYPRGMSFISWVVLINILYSFFVIVISNIASFHNNNFDNNGIVLAVQICMQVLSIIIMILTNIVTVSMKRFCILLKQLDESEFINGCCI